jgi:hypothetical protein
MKTELRLAPHSVLPGQSVVELWHDDQFIGTVTGADGPGVRIATQFAVVVAPAAGMVTEVRIDPSKSATWFGG